jgi:tagatose-1,6-bisphosphate aldolase
VEPNKIYKYDESLGNSYILLVTKKYDMGFPSVRKKIRRFYISFDGAQVVSKLTLYYRVDDGNWIEVDLIENINNNVYMYDLPRSKTAYWVQLKLEGELNYSIQDISIIYRPKLPK